MTSIVTTNSKATRGTCDVSGQTTGWRDSPSVHKPPQGAEGGAARRALSHKLGDDMAAGRTRAGRGCGDDDRVCCYYKFYCLCFRIVGLLASLWVKWLLVSTPATGNCSIRHHLALPSAYFFFFSFLFSTVLHHQVFHKGQD